MLSSTSVIDAVVDGIRRHELRHLVVDPVMVAKSGDRLLREDAVAALRDRLIPLAEVVTPNIPEAEVLARRSIRTIEDRVWAGKAILALGAQAVVIKGGHLEGDPVSDVLIDVNGVEEFRAPRIATTSTHGTGCTFSAAIAAGLAQGKDLPAAVGGAREYVSRALSAAPGLGHGHGPMNHFPLAEAVDVRR